ncbi:MAG: DUF4407 domain-containing protein [Limnohabitans sp.]|nr:DUF4407 domain-containing protein [Limnohabitans sp.]
MRIKEFLYFLSSAELFIIKECDTVSKHRFLINGLIIVIIGILSGASVTYAVYGSFDGNIYVSLFIGLLWTTFIIVLDSLIIASIKDTGTLWQKFIAAVPRIVLSVFIGIVIARPAEIKLFEKEIKDKLVDIELKKCRDRAFTETNRLRPNDTLINDRNKIQATCNKVSEELTCVQTLMTHETNGTKYLLPCGISSEKKGMGPRVREMEKRISFLKEQLKKCDSTLLIVRTQIARNDSIIRSAYSPCNQDTIKDKIKKEPLSLLQANTALNTLIFEDKEDTKKSNKSINEDNKGTKGGVGTMILFITILIILLEVTPVLAKVFQSPSEIYTGKLKKIHKDLETTMPFIELIGKYPYHPYYKKNGMIYKKLYDDYMSKDNLKKEKDLEDVINEQKIRKINQEAVNAQKIEIDKESQINRFKKLKEIEEAEHQEAANMTKASRIEIVKELLSSQKTKTLQDIKNNPEKYMNFPKHDPINPDSSTT